MCDIDGCDANFHHKADDNTCVGEYVLYDLGTAIVVSLDLLISPSPYLHPLSCLFLIYVCPSNT